MPASAATAISIGNFDGVHLGHRAIIQSARTLIGPQGRIVALVFDPNPATILRPANVPSRLTTFPHRTSLLREAGANEVVRLIPSGDLLAMTPVDFIRDVIHKQFSPSFIIEGPDFRFGRNRTGDLGFLRQIGPTYGFEVREVSCASTPLSDQSVVPVSSSLIRWLLSRGRADDAARCLGRPHRVSGTVTPGRRLGRTIGIPTINLAGIDEMLPMPGVYAGTASASDGTIYPAAINLGVRPTAEGVQSEISTTPVCECHLIGWDGPVDQYGWQAHISFATFIRPEMRFDSLQQLQNQIQRDIKRSADLFSLAAPAPSCAGNSASAPPCAQHHNGPHDTFSGMSTTTSTPPPAGSAARSSRQPTSRVK